MPDIGYRAYFRISDEAASDLRHSLCLERIQFGKEKKTFIESFFQINVFF